VRAALSAAVALSGLVAMAGVVTGPVLSQQQDGTSSGPPLARNVVVVLTDDMRADELAALPHVRRLIGDQGVTFSTAYAVDPVCCPSRVSLLTGQYAHSSGVEDNVFPRGGFEAFDDRSSLATWLDRAGYTTGYVGKYLNQYGNSAPRYVPPGWDVWKAPVRGVYAYRDPAVYNINGDLEELPGYQTDTVTSLATGFIRAHASEPMFLHVSYVAPHEATINGRLGRPPVPARRHQHAFDGALPPLDDPGYDEPDVTDKPPEVRLPRMTAPQLARTRVFAENRLESLLAVDEGVAAIVRSLRTLGLLDTTTIVFTSDNGLMLGEHRYVTEKKLVYEPSSRIPLLVRAPGVPSGVTRRHVVGLHDLAPTLLALTGADAPGRFTIDGRNLVPLMRDRSGTGTGRDLLIESLDKDSTWHSYDAIRTTSGHVYVEYARGGIELYDLATDPSQVDNLAGLPGHAGLQQRLARRLAAVRDCAGPDCR